MTKDIRRSLFCSKNALKLTYSKAEFFQCSRVKLPDLIYGRRRGGAQYGRWVAERGSEMGRGGEGKEGRGGGVRIRPLAKHYG